MLSLEDISIVTVTFNSDKIIEKFLLQDELKKIKRRKIIIVDNASADDTLKRIKKINKSFKVIKNKQNYGYGKAINIGIKKLETRYCLIVNPDLLFDLGFFENLLKGMKKYLGFGILAPKLINSLDLKITQKKDQDQLTNFVSGACFLIDPSIVKNKVFDENIFLFYEDNELSDRVMKLGYKLLILSECIVFHEGENSTSKNVKIDKLRNWHMGWSQAYYIWKSNNKEIFFIILDLLKKIKTLIFFVMFFNFKRAFPLCFRIKGIISFLKGTNSHSKKDIGPF